MEDQLFRLYRDTLERKSPYFKATFEEKLEPFSIANAITNSCPIVRIPEANAQHFAVLLDALEDFRHETLTSYLPNRLETDGL